MPPLKRFGRIELSNWAWRSLYLGDTGVGVSKRASTESKLAIVSYIRFVTEKKAAVSYFCFKYNFSLPCSYCFVKTSQSITQIFVLVRFTESSNKVCIDFSAFASSFPLFSNSRATANCFFCAYNNTELNINTKSNIFFKLSLITYYLY